MSRVLDYSVGRPGAAAIVQAGYIGVMRYVAPIPSSPPIFGGANDSAKVIFEAEYQELRAAGLVVGLNWEWYADRAREGAAAGTADAQEALRQAVALGYTGAIYFSVDYDAPVFDQEALNGYFKACAAVIGLSRLGCYAGYWPLKRLFDAGLITYGWQTIAWSGGNRESRAHLLQDTFGVLGGDADGNEVLKANWQGEVMDPNYTQTAPDNLLANNGFNVHGWICQNLMAATPADKYSLMWGLPQEENHEDGDGRWRQRFTYWIASQHAQTQSDFRLEALPAVAPPPLAPNEQAWLDVGPTFKKALAGL